MPNPLSRPPAHKLAAWAVNRAMSDFPYFLKFVKTVDEAEPNPMLRVKPFPIHKPYARYIAERLQATVTDPLWISKSRRVTMTWLECAEFLWRALQPHTHFFIQTKKEDDADWLIRERVWFMWQNLPEWFRYIVGKGEINAHYKFCKLTLPTTGKLWGIPQGGDQMAGYTPTGFFSDEAALQDEFEDAHTVILPQSEKGCVLRLVSSARPSYFGNIVCGPVAGRIQNPLPGVREWRLQKGGIVLEVHYSADPDKDPLRDGKDWYEQTVAKYPGGAAGSQWMQEMEISYSAYSGQLVYQGWDARGTRQDSGGPHVVRPFDLSGHPGPYWRAADYGIRNPFAVLWVTELDQTYYVIREFYEAGMTVENMKRAVHALSKEGKYAATWIDPRSDRHEQIGEGSAFYNLNVGEYSLRAIKANSSATGIEVVNQWLHDGRLKVFSDCTNFVREIENYRYEDWGAGVDNKHNLKEKTVKRDDHLMDALKYFANGVAHREHRKENPIIGFIKNEYAQRRERLMHPQRGKWAGQSTVMRGYYG